MNGQSAEGFQGTETILYDAIMVGYTEWSLYTCSSPQNEHQQWTLVYTVDFGRRWCVSQCRFINCDSKQEMLEGKDCSPSFKKQDIMKVKSINLDLNPIL